MPRLTAPDGRGLHYEDTGGEGPPVLCLAGLSRNGRDFEALARRLAPRFRVLRLDVRGRGRSDRAEDPVAEYSVQVECGDALALVDHLGLERVGVAGVSRGGMLGLAMAAARPGLVAALVLNDLGWQVEGEGLRRIAGYLGRTPPAKTFAEAAKALRDANAERFAGVPLPTWEAQARAVFDETPDGLALSYDPRLLEAVVAQAGGSEIGTVDLRPLFAAAAGTPMLVLRGANSDILTEETLAEMRAALPDLETLVVADRGHTPFLTEPEALDAVDGFLSRRLTA